MLGTLLVLWNLHRQARRASAEEVQSAAASWRDFHRAELVRQRDALRSVWLWYLAPMLPGMLLLFAGSSQVLSGGWPALVSFGLVAAFVGAVFVTIGVLNSKAAKRLQEEIEALDARR